MDIEVGAKDGPQWRAVRPCRLGRRRLEITPSRPARAAQAGISKPMGQPKLISKGRADWCLGEQWRARVIADPTGIVYQFREW